VTRDNSASINESKVRTTAVFNESQMKIGEEMGDCP